MRYRERDKKLPGKGKTYKAENRLYNHTRRPFLRDSSIALNSQ